MEHSSWPKMGFQLLKLSLLVNRKGTSEMGSESGENIFMLMGSDECPGQLFRGKDKKFRRRSCSVFYILRMESSRENSFSGYELHGKYPSSLRFCLQGMLIVSLLTFFYKE